MDTITSPIGQSFPLTEKHKLILEGKICPYCSKETVLVGSEVIYGRSYGMIYLCRDCMAYVGCHPNTTKSLGRVADGKLRAAKRQAHKYFDQIWKSGLLSRHKAYQWLSEQLGIPSEYTHIGMFKIETCNKVAQISYQYLKQNGK